MKTEPILKTLKNGLRLAMVPREAESVAVGVFVASGSRHEPAGLAGISHFIEHMLFKGTPTRSALDITNAIEGRGGNFNACTSEESTVYYAHLPNEYLSEGLEILSDMYLNAAFDPDEFEREKEVVLEEIKMYADEPDSVAQENMQRMLFPKTPLGAPVAGSEATLRPMKPSTLRKYVKSHYLASNTVVVVVGEFDPEVAVRETERSFRGVRAGKGDLPFIPVDFSIRPTGEMTVSKDVNQVQLALGYRTFGVGDERKWGAAVLDGLLGRGMSSRLFQEVREKRGLSYDISSRQQFYTDAGMMTITAGMDPAKKDLAFRTIIRELKRVVGKKAPAAELKRIKDFLVGNFRLSQEKMVSKMFFTGSTVLTYGELKSAAEQVERIRSVTAEEVMATARDIFREENRSVSWVTPR